jgi:hypothetical protein
MPPSKPAVLLSAAVALALVSGCTGSTGESPVIAAPTATATHSATPGTTVTTTRPATVSPSPSPDELSPKPGLETAAPLGRPACKGPDLTVTDADTLVDPSYRKEVFALRTRGPDCQLKGYPTVQIAGVTVQKGGFGLPPEQPQAVTLSRSTSLSFVISSARTGTCRDITSIVVTLPGTTTGHRVATSLRVCGPKVGLSPVHRQGDID